METELILAVVGIVFAVVALGGLSLAQQARIRREKQEKRRKALAAERPPAEALGPFFVARYRGSKARFFRVYDDDDAFLFLHAGPFVIMVDAEAARGTDGRHWLARSARLLVAGLAAGAAAAVAVLFAVGRGLARDAGNNPGAAGSTLYGVVGLIALLAVGLALALPAVVWRVSRRAAELDAMSPDELRAEAETDELSFRAAYASFFDIKFSHLEVGGGQVGATLAFRHKPTGTWRLETTTTKDTCDAIAAFRYSIGEDFVEVEEALEERLEGLLPERPEEEE